MAALHGAGHEISLVLTRPDRPAGRGLRVATSEVKQFALAHELPLFQPETLKSAEAADRIRTAGPQALVVAAYGLILSPSVLQAAPLGAVNIHASLLPRWRGAAPIERALLAGDRETGISIMQMDAGLDTGPVLSRQRIAILPDDDAGTLHDKLAALGARMIVEALPKLAAGTLRAEPQPEAGASYAAKISKAETALDWSRPATDLERAVRAFRPSPGARARFAGESIKVWRAEARQASGEACKVLSASGEGILVACGDGALLLTELQREGGRRLNAADFLRGRRLAAGERFE